MNEKPSTQSSTCVLAFYLVKFTLSTALEQERFEFRSIPPHFRSGQVQFKTTETYLLLTVVVQLFSFTHGDPPSSVLASTVEINGNFI